MSAPSSSTASPAKSAATASTPASPAWSKIATSVPTTPSARSSPSKAKAVSTPGRKYSERLRAACKEGAEDRRPELPEACPFGHKGTTVLRLCFARHVAGVWALVVRTISLSFTVAFHFLQELS